MTLEQSQMDTLEHLHNGLRRNTYIDVRWNNDDAGSLTKCAGTVTYAYAGTLTQWFTQEHLHKCTLEQS